MYVFRCLTPNYVQKRRSFHSSIPFTSGPTVAQTITYTCCALRRAQRERYGRTNALRFQMSPWSFYVEMSRNVTDCPVVMRYSSTIYSPNTVESTLMLLCSSICDFGD